MECIRSLYGDPEFTQDLVFTPERHYTTHERKSRVYNEMYTCEWWWAVQVRASHLRIKALFDTVELDVLGVSATRRDDHSPYCLVRQDAVNAFPREDGLSDLSNDRKYPQRYPPKANAPGSSPDRVHSNYQV